MDAPARSVAPAQRRRPPPPRAGRGSCASDSREPARPRWTGDAALLDGAQPADRQQRPGRRHEEPAEHVAGVVPPEREERVTRPRPRTRRRSRRTHGRIRAGAQQARSRAPNDIAAVACPLGHEAHRSGRSGSNGRGAARSGLSSCVVTLAPTRITRDRDRHAGSASKERDQHRDPGEYRYGNGPHRFATKSANGLTPRWWATSKNPSRIDWSARSANPMWNAASQVKNRHPAATAAATRADLAVSRAGTRARLDHARLSTLLKAVRRCA